MWISAPTWECLCASGRTALAQGPTIQYNTIQYNTIQYKKRDDLKLEKKHYESTFIEVDKSLFKTNRNVIIGEIYRPPSSKIKSFNSELEKNK